MKLFILFTLIISFQIKADWECDQITTQKIENIDYEHNYFQLRVCGIGEGQTKKEAQDIAYEHASKRFQLLCNNSEDCKLRQYSINPQAIKCLKNEKGLECTQLFEFNVKRSSKVESYLVDAVELKINIFNSKKVDFDRSPANVITNDKEIFIEVKKPNSKNEAITLFGTFGVLTYVFCFLLI